MHANEKPYKVWSCDRETRKSVIASSLGQLKSQGALKLGYSVDDASSIRVVLEADGTEIEDDQYFQLADKETVFLLLKQEEKWLPAGVEALKSAISAFPGNVTVVLQLDNREPGILLKRGEPPWRLEVVSVSDSRQPDSNVAQTRLPNMTNGASATSLSQFVSNSLPSSGLPQQQAQQISTPTVRPNGLPITATSPHSHLLLDGLKVKSSSSSSLSSHKILTSNSLPFISSPSAPKLGLEEDDDDSEGSDRADHTGDAAQQGLQVSPNHDHSQCDFHCAALHRDGAEIRVSRSVATSPITESPIPSGLSSSPISINVPIITGPHLVSSKPRHLLKGVQHVRFMDIEQSTRQTNSGKDAHEGHKIHSGSANIANLSQSSMATNGGGSDSETETTEREDEQFSERYLLLTDQLSLEQDKHLSLKDIGIILERLNSKIVDVDKLEREKESPDCYNWIIKATIRGEVLREIGVIYNGQYYGIMEHPGYF